MARIRFVLVAVIILALGSCQLLEQQDNYISFTLDGVQYTFTVSAVKSDHPYAIGYYWVQGGPVKGYTITGSSTAAGAAAEPPEETLRISISDNSEGWSASAYFFDSWGSSMYFDLGWIPLGMMDSFITNRDEVGEQFAGSLPGPFSGGEVSELKNIIFSVERLPDELVEIN